MVTINYAFRDDPLNVYMLTEGVCDSKKYTQFMAFRKREVAVNLLTECFVLDSKAPGYGTLTPVGCDVLEKKWQNTYGYCAYIESQIEFVIRRSTLEHILPTFYPLWTTDVLLSFFGDQPSGFITILRVYKLSTGIEEALFAKGRQGSSQTIQLYHGQNPTSVNVDVLDPVIPDGRFQYLKEELIYSLKKDNALIAVYENNDAGCRSLKDRIEAGRVLRTKNERIFDPDAGTDVDMAQIDYSLLYKEVRQISPEMRRLVDYISRIKPAQIGEADYLIEKLENGDRSVKQRIIEMNMRSALRFGLYMHKKYGSDLEEATGEALFGLVVALDKYDGQKDSKFSIYAAMWMRQVLSRFLPVGKTGVHFAVHLRPKLFQVLEFLNSHICADCSSGQYCEESISYVMQIMECGRRDSIRILSLLFPHESLDEMLEGEVEISDFGLAAESMERYIFQDELKSCVADSLQILRDRESEVIRGRYGFDGDVMTLEQLGSTYSLTRERIRQIEANAIRKLQKKRCHKLLNDFWLEL